MNCSDLRSELPLYFDDVLSPETVSSIDAHLAGCPLCRQSLAEMREIRNELRSLSRPRIAPARLASIRRAVAAEAAIPQIAPAFRLVEQDRRRWVDVWLMPSMVGSAASVVFGISLLWLLLMPASGGRLDMEIARGLEAARQPAIIDPLTEIPTTPLQYASTRLAFSEESPSINPQGALVALTRSLLRGEMKDEEVVVVADVFGDGLARIAEVVEPSKDEAAVRELKEALQSDPAFAPFVPANLDHRSESVRVVLRVQTVKVHPDEDGRVR